MKEEDVIKKIEAFLPYLNEAQARLYVASEAKALGRGGKRLIEKELGISHNIINRGIAELESSQHAFAAGKQSMLNARSFKWIKSVLR